MGATVTVESYSSVATLPSGGSCSPSVTLAAGKRNLLVCLIGGGNFSHVNVKYNGSGGASFTLGVGRDDTQDEAYIYYYIVPESDSGSKTVYVDNNASQDAHVQIYVVSGFDTTSPSLASNSYQSMGTTEVSYNVSATYKATQLVVAAGGNAYSTTYNNINMTETGKGGNYFFGYRTAESDGATLINYGLNDSIRVVSVGWMIQAAENPVNLTLDTATTTATGQIIDQVSGAVSRALNTGIIQATGRAITVGKGAVSKLLDTATLVATGRAIALVKGAVSKALQTAAINATGRAIDVVRIQIIRPNADTSLGSWVDQANGTINIYQSIDESAVSDADYVQSPINPSNNIYKFKLQTALDPNIHTGHSVTVRYCLTTGSRTLTIRLIEGTTTRATWVKNPTGSWYTDTLTVSEAEAAAITDYSNLYLELEAD